MTELTFNSTDADLLQALADNPNVRQQTNNLAGQSHAQVLRDPYAPRAAAERIWREFQRKFVMASGPVSALRLALEAQAAMADFAAMSADDRATFVNLENVNATRPDGIPTDARLAIMQKYPMLGELVSRYLTHHEAAAQATAAMYARAREAEQAKRPAALVAELEARGTTVTLDKPGTGVVISPAGPVDDALLAEIKSLKPAIIGLLKERAAAVLVI